MNPIPLPRQCFPMLSVSDRWKRPLFQISDALAETMPHNKRGPARSHSQGLGLKKYAQLEQNSRFQKCTELIGVLA